jgi:hypothetical protein
VHFSTRAPIPITTTIPPFARTIGIPGEQPSDGGGSGPMNGTHRTDGPLTHRDRAILRAVDRGTAEIAVGPGCDLFLDGRCCADQLAAQRLARAGLIAAATVGALGERVAVRLTAAGRLAVGSAGARTAGRTVARPDRPTARPAPVLAATG